MAVSVLTHPRENDNLPLNRLRLLQIRSFVLNMQKSKLDNFGVIFAAFEIPGYDDYKEVAGFNITRRPYLVNFGKFYTYDEVMKLAEGRTRNLEEWAFGQLSGLCAPSYLANPDS